MMHGQKTSNHCVTLHLVGYAWIH